MRERIHAPDFSFVKSWLNAGRPISIRELRGQVVVLDFWTYCCVNCMHVLPVLRDLEERHREDPLVVIGVHSAKFDAEKDALHIRAAMERYGVAHPVALDEEMEVWSRYAIRSWPTLVVIRPDGTLAAVAPGEPDPDVLESFIARELAEGRANGTLAKTPLRFGAGPDGAPSKQTALSYPGKAIATPNGRLFVADSGHHRVLVLDSSGRCLDSIGSGRRGHEEGAFAEAALDDPQGLALDGDALYIADARAHAIWRADLKTRTVYRLAGTFELGRAPLAGTGKASETPLRSPWDLALRGHTLLIALAGSHQLAVLDLRDGILSLLAGSGREALQDGPAREAALAQPSGLSLSGATLFIADSESSAVRALDLDGGQIGTLAGGPGLFDFGDRVGPLRSAMLQHPLAVLATPEGVLVADTYNDKLKRFSRDRSRLEPFFSGADGVRLAQPAGLSLLPGGEVLVADTNNHRLVAVAPDGASARVIEVEGASAQLEVSRRVESELLVTLRSVACDARDHAACFPVQNMFRVPLRLLREGQREVRYALALEADLKRNCPKRDYPLDGRGRFTEVKR